MRSSFRGTGRGPLLCQFAALQIQTAVRFESQLLVSSGWVLRTLHMSDANGKTAVANARHRVANIVKPGSFHESKERFGIRDAIDGNQANGSLCCARVSFHQDGADRGTRQARIDEVSSRPGFHVR